MKVLHVINSLGVGGGAEHSLIQQLQPLRERGIDGEIAVLIERGFGLEERAREMGYTVHVLPGPSLRRRVQALRALVKVVQPDVVHATLWDSCIVSRVVRLTDRTPLINSIVTMAYEKHRVESLPYPKWKHNASRLVDAMSIRVVDRIHANALAVADDTRLGLRVRDEKITVIPRGRTAISSAQRMEARDRIRESVGVSDDTKVIVTVGRQDSAKDLTTLVHAFALVRRSCPDTRLWLVGRPGTDTEAIDEAIDELGVRESVAQMGHRDDVLNLLSAADVFALPSIFEGFGGAAVEALGIGIPMVLSDIPGFRENVGDFARFFEVRDVRGMARELLAALEEEIDEAERDRARADFEERFSLNVIVDQLADLYQTVSPR